MTSNELRTYWDEDPQNLIEWANSQKGQRCGKKNDYMINDILSFQIISDRDTGFYIVVLFSKSYEG